jgi:hypothetical protein
LSIWLTLNGGLAITKSKRPTESEVFVVGVALLDFAAQAVHGQIEPGEAGGVGDTLLAVDGDVGGGVFAVFFQKVGRLDEHAAGTAGGIEDAAVVGFEDFDDQPDEGGGV